MYRKRAFHLWDKEKRSQLTSASTHREYQRRSHSLAKVCEEPSEKQSRLLLLGSKVCASGLGISYSLKRLSYEPRKINASSETVTVTNEEAIFVSCLEPGEPLGSRKAKRCVNYIIAGSGAEAPAQGDWSYFLPNPALPLLHPAAFKSLARANSSQKASFGGNKRVCSIGKAQLSLPGFLQTSSLVR